MKQLHQIQTHVTLLGFSQNDYVTPKLVAACAELKRMTYAHRVFDQIPEPNFASWNALLRGYAKNEGHREVVALFCKMKNMDIMPNCYTFPVVIKCCGRLSRLVEGEEVHCVVIKCGFRENAFVGTTLIEMYAAGGVIGAAYKVFGEMFERNVVAWTSMINGYISCGDMVSAQRLFDLAPERDIVLWNTMVSGYIAMGDMVTARKIFDKMPRRDVMCWNTVLNGYASNQDIEACEDLFEKMPERNVFSWNGLIGGYARSGRFIDVVGSFKQMLSEGNVLPNDATLTTVLSACARLGALDFGTWVHVYAENIGYKKNVFVGNALIDMYAKCGVVDNAVDVFKNMEMKDLITWNTIICGLATHGRGGDALELFTQMKNCKVKPDGITFIGILCSCTHLGLVEDGMSYFQSMASDYSIVPQIEHYGCMVDMLGRAGLLEQAAEFVRQMPIEADVIIWTALLGACRIYKNIELAELCLEQLIELEPKNPANYVMLSNIYGDLGRWKDLARLKVAIRDTGYKKFPGISSIEANHGVVEFCSLDNRHPETEDIYEALEGLTNLLRSFGYVPDILELGHGD
ncbi:pentatricopeptide repeat-containing protein At1g08070, chloroplastic [Argentina anserina]|uniref:pentatricopeptide repeat-containing protein At1g08070, chloroplastic n=1 Tax=Argentina anserina TaxID=57926 RepID=UPI0021768210|nr:pentatricopeptide repeat-containing protein At1g08070, chloroplastic [Potentilla anserina]XP_050374422.1 pentatricopeptide repeat-containing protein At1g08070, chloroplastic [Potentilla anserina]